MTNKRLFRLSVFAGALLLAACDAPSAVWSKPGVTREEYASDNADCEQAVKETNFGVGATTGANRKAFYEKCMTDLGYTKDGEKSGTHLHNPPGILEPAH